MSGWLEDFAQLKRELSSHYANLEWAIESRGLDLRQLSEQTESRLRRAKDDAEAREIIESFLGAFGDGHLAVDWPAGGAGNSSPPGSEPAPRPSLCARLGYRDEPTNTGVVFSRLPNYRELKTPDSKYFPVGVLHLSGKKRVGVLRISLFTEHIFPDLCESATSELKLGAGAECDETCEDAVERKAGNLLTAALERQLLSLRRERITALLIDITGNGGGTNWYQPAARTLTAKPLRSSPTGFIRHEHWARQLEERLRIIETDMRHVAPARQRLLSDAADATRKALAEVRRPCDRSGVWENREPRCSLVVPAPASSFVPYAKPGELPDRPSSYFLFRASTYAYHEGVYPGPLMVLVDGGTGSSAEAFAAMLRDGRAAVIVGLPTVGAGCGYTNGGIPTVLKNSGARVKIPDCVRFRADGTNEVAGITPDVLIPWRRNDSRYQRAKRVFDALSETPRLRSRR